MGFDAIIRGGIVTADGLTKSLQVKGVGLRRWAGQDGFGKVTYIPAAPAAALPVNAIVETKDQVRPVPGGGSITIMATVLILERVPPLGGGIKREEPIDPRDIVILPDGRTGPIVNNPGLLDPTTKRPYFAEIELGKQ